MMTSKIIVKNNNFNTIDIMKFICALMVISIHTEPFSFSFLLDSGLGVLTRIAVPFFFVSSGFLFFKNDKLNPKKLIKFLKKVGILYILWNIVYFPFININFSLDNNFNSLKLLRVFFIEGSYPHLWFLPALAFATVTVFLLLKIFKESYKVFVVSLVFLAVGLIFSTYYVLVEDIYFFRYIKTTIIDCIGTRNGLFYAFPYVAMGSLIAAQHNKLSNNNKYILFFISFIFFLFESFFAVIFLKVKSTILWIFIIPTMYFLFKILLTIELKDSKIFGYIRKMSTLMYTSHYLFILLFSYIFNIINFGNRYSNILLFFIVTMSSIIFSIGFIKISENEKFKYLKYMY